MAVTVDGASPPSISFQSQSVSLQAGDTLSFSVVASGTAPLRYQWYNRRLALSGQTASTFSIASVSAPHSGDYKLRVSNSYGYVDSEVMYIAFREDGESPIITSRLQNMLLQESDTLNLSVAVSGTAPLSYQWYKNDAPIRTAKDLSISRITQADVGFYKVVVYNIYGEVSSNTVTVSIVKQAPKITTQPKSKNIVELRPLFLSVTAVGSSLNYQWYKDNQIIPGQTSSDLLISRAATPADGGEYKVKVSNPYGEVYSNTVEVLVVGQVLKITRQPLSIAVGIK